MGDNANLPQAFMVMHSWGFIYKTCFVTWIKTVKMVVDQLSVLVIIHVVMPNYVTRYRNGYV